MIYLSSSNIKYYFVGDSELIERIPDKFNFERVSGLNFERIRNEGYFSVRFVFFREPSAKELNGVKNLGSYVIIGDDSVKFDNKELKVIGDELRYGAIFSDNFDNYKCAVERGMDEVEVISLIYSEKARLLSIKNSGCFYSGIKDSLGQYSRLSQSLNMEGLFRVSEILIEQNKQLDRQGCSVVF